MTAQPVETREDQSRLLAAIRAAKAGDTSAFEEIMYATERRVAQLCWRILGDAEDVKDAVQETFLRVFRFLDQYHEDRDFFGWLFRITVNVSRDTERRRRRWRLFGPMNGVEPIAKVALADDALSAGDDLALLTRAIDALPRKQRLAILLRDVQEMPTEEVAEILGTKTTTLRVTISKARAKLRQWMEEHR
ncbi:MAG: RNA polymerase sigma factor [Thermoanaerobaculia bacterium]